MTNIIARERNTDTKYSETTGWHFTECSLQAGNQNSVLRPRFPANLMIVPTPHDSIAARVMQQGAQQKE